MKRLMFGQRTDLAIKFFVACVALPFLGAVLAVIGFAAQNTTSMVLGIICVPLAFIALTISLQLGYEVKHGDSGHPLFFERWVVKKHN